MAGGISNAGAERVFKIVETGVSDPLSFTWSAKEYSAPRGTLPFGVKQRTVREDYPGGETPVEQVLGWNYTPFTLSGVWDDRYAGEGFALFTLKEFEKLVQRGNLCLIQFEQQSFYGILTDANFTYKRKDYIGYSFTVSPHYREKGQTVVTKTEAAKRATEDPKTAVAQARKALEDLQAAQTEATADNLSMVQTVLKTSVFSDVNAFLDEISSKFEELDDIVDNQILVAEEAAAAFSRAAQILSTIRTKAQETLTALYGVASTTDLGVDTVRETLDFEVWVRGLRATSWDLVVAAYDAERNLNARAMTPVKRLHRARKGESLYAISNQYYGTPFYWPQILERNNLTDLTLAGGELLIIPEVE